MESIFQKLARANRYVLIFFICVIKCSVFRVISFLVISLVLSKSHKRFNKQSGLNVWFVLLKSSYEVLLNEMV